MLDNPVFWPSPAGIPTPVPRGESFAVHRAPSLSPGATIIHPACPLLAAAASMVHAFPVSGRLPGGAGLQQGDA